MAESVEARPWPAPAKLNLMLRVLGRRPDGYHRLQTVFQFIDRQDRLFFESRAMVEFGGSQTSLAYPKTQIWWYVRRVCCASAREPGWV